MSEKDAGGEMPSDLSYMEELSRAYAAALKRRLEKGALPSLSEEKASLLVSLQREVWAAGETVIATCRSEERKELALILRESAAECISLCAGETPKRGDPVSLPRAVISANRSLNLLIRHGDGSGRAILLIQSELAALYALAAIG